MGSRGNKQKTPSYEEMMQAQSDWNRINQFSPFGSTVYSDGGRTATNTFSPEMQEQFDLQMGVGNSALAQLLGFANDPSKFNFGNQDILEQFMTPGGDWGSSGASGYGSFGGGASVPGFEGLQDMITYSGPGGDANIGPGYEGNLDFAGIESFLPEQGDLLAARDRSEGAMFDRMMGLTDPVFERRKAQEAEMLANRGIGEGSEIWGTYGQQYGEDYGRALTAAQQDAISEGRAETESLFGMGLETGKQALTDRLAEIATQNQKQQMIEAANLNARGQEWNERYGQGSLAQQAAATSTQAAANRARTMQGDRQFDAQMALQAAIQQWQQQMAGYGNLASLAGYGAQGTPGMGYGPGMVDVLGSAQQDLANRQFDFQTSPWAMGMDLLGNLGGAALSGLSWGK